MLKKLELSDLKELIVAEQYFVVPGSTTTVCSIELKNGFQIIGKSACLVAEDYDAELGQKYAFENALNKMWELEGYHRASVAAAPVTEAQATPTKIHTPKDRVLVELSSLNEAIGRLTTFIRNGRPSGMTDQAWELLHEQAQHMCAYAQVLITRLESWGD